MGASTLVATPQNEKKGLQTISSHNVFNTLRRIARGRIDLFPNFGWELVDYLQETEEGQDPKEYGKSLGEKAFLVLSVLMATTNQADNKEEIEDRGDRETPEESTIDERVRDNNVSRHAALYNVSAGYFLHFPLVWPISLSYIVVHTLPPIFPHCDAPFRGCWELVYTLLLWVRSSSMKDFSTSTIFFLASYEAMKYWSKKHKEKKN